MCRVREVAPNVKTENVIIGFLFRTVVHEYEGIVE
jgi:hypothetical protein